MTRQLIRIIMPPPSCIKRSLGTGRIERRISSHSNKENVLSDHDQSFVVVFRAITSAWCDRSSSSSSSTMTTTTIETTKASNTNNAKTLTTLLSTDSSIGGGETNTSTSCKDNSAKDAFDMTTDVAYHNRSEQEGSQTILQQLTADELTYMPDEFMPLRHYRAEKGDISKAIDAIKLTLGWRKEFQVDRIVKAIEDVDENIDAEDSNKNSTGETNNENFTEKSTTQLDSDVSNEEASMLTMTDLASILRKENETGKIYVRGYDKDGRSLMYMRPGNENTGNENNNMRHLVFQIEKAVRCSNKNGFGKICLVIDYEGFHISKSPPMSTSKRTLEILQRHYCERLHRAYICNPPFVFRSFYTIIKPFVDPVTKQKVCFCVGHKGLQQIVDDVGGKSVAHKSLEKCCGGEGDVREFDSTEYMSLPLSTAFDEEV